MTDKLGAQPDAIVNGPFEGRNAESIQKNFEKIFRRLKGFDGGQLVLPTDGDDGSLLIFEDGAWGSLEPGNDADVLTVVGGEPAWAAPVAQNDYMGLDVQNQWAIFGRITGATLLTIGVTTPTITGTQALSNQADSTYVSQLTGAVAGNDAAVIGVAGACQPRHDPVLTMIIRTGTSLAAVRYWFGLSTVNFTNADTPGGASNFVAFRYSTVAADPGWVGVMRDGATQSVTGLVAAIAASTRYKLKIRFVTGTGAYFSVNGGPELLLSTNPPGGTSSLIPYFGIFTTAAGAKDWLLSRVHCRYGS